MLNLKLVEQYVKLRFFTLNFFVICRLHHTHVRKDTRFPPLFHTANDEKLGEAWGRGLGARPGGKAWGRGLGMRPGDEAWGRDLGARPGDEAWGRGYTDKCSLPDWMQISINEDTL